MILDGINRIRQYNMTERIGHGYIVIPKRINREDYIRNAIRRQKVTILPEQGSSYIFDCYISKEAFANVVFPIDSDSLGSAVVYVTPLVPNKPFVIGVMTKEDETNLVEEKEFEISKAYNDNSVSINGNALAGELIINVANFEGAANCLINLLGNENSNFRIKCQTNATIYSDQEVNLETLGKVRIKSSERDNESNFSYIDIDNKDVIIFPQNTLKIAKGSEPIPKGNELVKQLNATNTYLNTLVSAIQTALTTIDTTAGSASSAPFRTTMSNASFGNYDNVNSQISFTD